MNTPRVSVVMAVYNAAPYLRESMDSVLSQDFTDFEFVIVDDCSTDATPAIIAGYGDARIVHLRNDRNAGQTPSLNRGLRAARGEYVARIDGDDAYRAGKLRRQIAFLDAHPEIAVCGTGAVKFDGEGHEFGLFIPPVRPADIRFTIHHRVPVCHVSVMMRRDPVLACGGYDERYKYAADYALWSTLLKRGYRIANLSEPLTKYREFRASLGAVHKLGTAGDESARIIADNADALGCVTLSTEESRDIALLFFPAAGLATSAITRAYRNLRRLASVTYGTIPWRVSLQLRAVLFWSLLKRAMHEEPGRPAATGRRELVTEVGRSMARPDVAVLGVAAWVLSLAGESRIVRWKDSTLPRLMKRLR
ncbi:MAG TPA: glycosyltransferase [Vicinamibacterales bacterium]|nr:glycosyltransferase [Vicinamibacterales bacterium]